MAMVKYLLVLYYALKQIFEVILNEFKPKLLQVKNVIFFNKNKKIK